MGFNPLDEKGISDDQQLKNWSELTLLQYDKSKVDPYTRCRIITMNGVEVEGAFFKHCMARMNKDMELRQKIALTRRFEQQQQKAISALVPGNESNLEVTIGYEQVAVDLTAWLAQHEKDPYVKAAMEFGLLEDFDHLYRYSNLLDMLEGKKAEEIVGHNTEITPGRPTIEEHRHPFDTLRKCYDPRNTDILTQLQVMVLTAAEQQTMNYYMNVANRYENTLARQLWTEIGMIEEQHVSQYESLMPPVSWFMDNLLHEYAECWMYWSFMDQETDPKIKAMWELFMNMEIEHIHDAVELMKKYEGKDAAEFLPREMPEGVRFQSNIDYIRNVLGSQMELTAKGVELVNMNELPGDYRYFEWMEKVNTGGNPTQQVITRHISEKGEDYRWETAPHPYKLFQDRKKAETIPIRGKKAA